MTLEEALCGMRGKSKEAKEAALRMWADSLPELPHGILSSEHADEQPCPRNYLGVDWSEVG